MSSSSAPTVDQSFAEALTSEGESFDRAWAEFLFNAEKLCALRTASKEVLLSILHADQNYGGAG